MIFDKLKTVFLNSDHCIDGPIFILPDGTFMSAARLDGSTEDYVAHCDVEDYLYDEGESTNHGNLGGDASPTLRKLGCIRCNNIEEENNYIELSDVKPTHYQYLALETWLDLNSFHKVAVCTPNMEEYVEYSLSDVDYIISRIKRYYSSNKLYESSEEFFDYGTAEVDGSDVVDTHTTGVSFYDDFLNPKQLDYLKQEKNLVGKIVMMSPETYYQECEKYGFDHVVSAENLKKQRAADTKTIQHLTNVLTKYKHKFPLPFINKAHQGQEGLHRMLVIANLFGWDHEVPVLIVEWADPDRASREAEEERVSKLERRLAKAVDKALEYRYTDVKDFEDQLQYCLDNEFEYIDDISKPVEFQIEFTDTLVKVDLDKAHVEFDTKEINIISKDEKDNFEGSSDVDLDLDDIDDWLERYLGNDWKNKFPDAKKKLTKSDKIDESFDSDQKEIIVKVLDSHNKCYYQDTSMALEIICEDLFYNHDIDARYKGRSIYVGEERIATIMVSREGPDLLGMYGYRLFI